jgi:lantibiotic modifying enzyme
MPLYEPARHEALTSESWDASKVRTTLETWVRETVQAGSPRLFWPIHPSDDEAGGRPQKSLYVGAAGVIVALHRLQQDLGIEHTLDLAALADAAWSAYRAEPDVGRDVPSIYLGALGILYAKAVLGRVEADEIATRVAANAQNPTLEHLWGAPGTMLLAHHLARQGGEKEQRFRRLYLESARELWRQWQPEADGVFVWEQDLYGSRLRYLGAAHGAAGNIFALLVGADWMPEAERATLYERASQFLLARSRVEGDRANVPPYMTSSKWLVQWCHGAPGIITSYRPFPRDHSPAVERRLLELGELTWGAGPVVKGPSLCHGTAGNGYALLQLFERTGDEVWLDRARRFAMHAVGQIEQHRAEAGMYHYALFTGDAGAALFLADCLRASARFPLLDAFP